MEKIFLLLYRKFLIVENYTKMAKQLLILLFVSISANNLAQTNKRNDVVQKEGQWFDFHENGKLASQGNYKNGMREGQWLWYFKNGQLNVKGNFKSGKKEGEWRCYYQNGQLRCKGNYKRDQANDEWFWYLENGQMANKGSHVAIDEAKLIKCFIWD